MLYDDRAGHYIPQLAKLVYEQNVKGVKSPDINLKGLMVCVNVYYKIKSGRMSPLFAHFHANLIWISIRVKNQDHVF